MNIRKTTIPDVLIIEPRVFTDERGFFMETFHARKFAEHGLPQNFVQDNHSGSKRGTLRGLHYQIRPWPACASAAPFVPRTTAARRCETAGTGEQGERQAGEPDIFSRMGSLACTCLSWRARPGRSLQVYLPLGGDTGEKVSRATERFVTKVLILRLCTFAALR